jgi:hypothetical protein
LLKLLPGILKTIARLTGLPLGDAASALEGAQLTPEQAAAVQDALQRHEQAMKALSVEELKAVISENVAMVTSPDKYVSRARPTGLYIFYAITGVLAVAKILGAAIDPSAIVTILLPLGGTSGLYVYQRTQEKLGKNGNSE